MSKKAILIIFMCLFIGLVESADKSPSRDPNTIRIGLITKARKVKINIKGALRVADLDKDKIYKIVKRLE